MSHPRETLQTIGHVAQQQLLLELINKQTLPQTLLFAGPKGIGKATLAYQLACYLFAGGEGSDALFGPTGLDVNRDAPPVKRVQAGSHGDLLVIEPELSGQNQQPIIKVDAVRQVGEFLSMTASESDWRVVIIDGAEHLNLNAANALLKAVEEPPLNSVMILITHQFGRLLPTLKSRCRQLHFRGLSTDHFSHILTQHSNPAVPDALFVLSGGSPGQAIELASKDAVSMYQDILNCFDQYPTWQPDRRHAMMQRVDKAAKDGGWPLWCTLWRMFLTRLILSSQSCLKDAISADEAQLLHTLAAAQPVTFWQSLLQESDTLIGQSQSLHLDRKQVIQSLLQCSFGTLKHAA